MKILDQSFADYDQPGIRVTCRVDIAPLNPAGTVVLKGVTAV